MAIAGLLVLRLAAGIGAIVLAALHSSLGLEHQLTVSLLVMGIFILVETVVSALWALCPGLTAGGGSENVYSDAAKLAITTQGVVLGLISFSRADVPSQTIKVGAASLAAGVLIASSLYLLVVNSTPSGVRGWLASVFLTVLLWLLAFGLLCVVSSLWVSK